MSRTKNDMEFNPKFFLKNGLVQTLLPYVLLKKTSLKGTIEHFVQLDDGDEISLLENKPLKNNGKLVLLIHGLGSSAHDLVVRNTANEFLSNNYTVYRMNHRGVANGASRARHIYHGGRHEDVLAIVKYITGNLQKDEKLSIIAFSLSSNILFLSAAKNSSSFGEISGIVGVSPVFDLKSSSKAISTKYFGYFNFVFMKSIKKYFATKEKFNTVIVHPDFKLNKLLCEFDDKFVAPAAGYDDGESYYRSVTALPVLHEIRIPASVICAVMTPSLSLNTTFVIQKI